MLDTLSVPLVVGSVFTVLFAHWLVRFTAVLFSHRGQPGYVALCPPFSMWPSVLFGQKNPRLCFSRHAAWLDKGQLFRRYHSSVLAVRSLFPPTVTVLVGDGKLVNHVNSDRKTFTKAAGSNPPVTSHYGFNLLSADGDEWRRHRRIAVSSFNTATTAKVWDEAVTVTERFQTMLKAEAVSGKTVVHGFEDLIASLALINSSISLYQANKIDIRDYAIPSLVPWALGLPIPKIQRVRAGYQAFEDALKEIIEQRRKEIVAETEEGDKKQDLLSAIVRANLREEGKNRLSDRELLSNAYIFELAGHEPVHAEIAAYLSSGRPFTYSDAYNSLPVTLATIYEGLRLAGPVAATPKVAVTDAVLEARTYGKDSGARKVFVPQGAVVRSSLVAAHYDADIWPDPFTFKPSRFMGKDWDSESFLPFSSGLRGCIGKTFALAELVVVTALTLHRYRLAVPEEVQAEWKLREGESERERRDRILKPSWPITMGPNGIDIAFVEREKEE
ncbi:hypothetical protein JCM8097_003294 [Rhodosporidiobolus ruineniae]